MNNNVVEKSELELRRNLGEAKTYIDNILTKVKSLSDEVYRYRLSKGYYKKFKEEYVPIFNYLVFKYGYDINVIFKYVGIGNQAYDAEIEVNGEPIKIEITYLTLGKLSKERNEELNNTGYSFRFYEPREEISKYKDLIFDTAKKKSSKFYGDTLLIIYFPCEEMYPGDYILSIDILENIIDSLKTINYNSNRVELFIPGKSISNYLGERELPPEVYVIK